MKYFFFPANNGVRGYSKKRFVSVYIDRNGKNRINTKTIRRFYMFDIPFIRGLLYFFFGMIYSIKTLSESIKIQTENMDKEIKKTSMKTKRTISYVLAILLSLIFSFLLLGYLPSKLSFSILGLTKNFYLRNLVIATLKVGIILFSLIVLKFIPIMQELYRFNGAINTLQNRDENDKTYHKPLNFLNYFIFIFILSIFVITLVGISLSFWKNWLINLSILLVIISISYEFLFLISKNKYTEKLCVITSFFVCMKPNTTHDEMIRILYSQLCMKDKNYGEKMEDGKIPLSNLLAEMQTKLVKANKYDRSDVEWIIATVLGKNRAEAKLVRSFDEKTYREILKATEQRAQGKPLSAIFGFVDFFGLRFNVNRKVLAPRMETEILVEEVLKVEKNIKKSEILEIGTGSGAIAIALAKNCDTKITSVDISKSALEVAKENAKLNQVKINFIQSDLFKGLKKGRKFDIIVSNPPYIPTKDIEKLDEEVKKYDPILALDGGEDGLDFYRRIIDEGKNNLKKNGYILFEIGKGEYVSVKKLFEKNGYSEIIGIKDYNKIYRVVKARYGNGK